MRGIIAVLLMGVVAVTACGTGESEDWSKAEFEEVRLGCVEAVDDKIAQGATYSEDPYWSCFELTKFLEEQNCQSSEALSILQEAVRSSDLDEVADALDRVVENCPGPDSEE